jgi:hypothetical protein
MTGGRAISGVALNYADGVGKHVVPIHDARVLRDALSLDREGFELRRLQTAVRNFYDAEEVRAVFYPEIETLLKNATGASRAVAFEHDVRVSRGDRPSGSRAPVPIVHDDYTEVSTPGRIRLYLPDDSEALLQGRYGIINLWHPITGPVLESPLAVCEAGSIDPSDLIPTTTGVKHEVYQLRFRPAHRWFYFPQMRTDEILLFKCYDSVRDGRARFTAHTAFDDPSTPPDAPRRESIEVRALVLF